MKRSTDSSPSGDAKRVRRDDDDDDVWFPGAYDELKKPVDEQSHSDKLSAELTGKPSALLVRASYAKLYLQIRYGKATFVHVSGNPGTGKSCCIWYFVNQLLNDAEVNKCHVVVQLVDCEEKTYLVISPDGAVKSSTRVPRKVLRLAGTWLLVDQRFTGTRARRGTTVLFASPSGAAEAGKTMDESCYETFYLDAWKPAELLKAFNRVYRDDLGVEVLTRTGYRASVHPPGHFRCKVGGYSAAAHFLARMYVCGGIARYFFEDLGRVMSRQVAAVSCFIETGAQAEERSKSHKVFYSRPSFSLREVDDAVLVSPYVRKVYTAKTFAATVKDREKLSNLAKFDSKYASAAGEIFEDYAHLLLSSRGGTYSDIIDPSFSVTLKPRERNTFYGNKFKHEKGMYDLPLSECFGIVDSASPEDGLLLQMSRAKSRGLMDRALFEQLVELCQREMRGDGATIKGAAANQPVFVHVRPHDTGPVKELGLKEPDGMPEGNQRWRRAPLPIPQVSIRLPPMDKVTLAPVYEELTEVLESMEKAVQRGEDLFVEEASAVCEGCGEIDVEGEASDDFCQCKQCKGWLHGKCMPSGGEGRCVTCCLLKLKVALQSESDHDEVEPWERRTRGSSIHSCGGQMVEIAAECKREHSELVLEKLESKTVSSDARASFYFDLDITHRDITHRHTKIMSDIQI